MPGTFNEHERPGEVDIGAGLAQLLLDPLRGLRVGDVDRAAAPRMADRAVDQGMPRIPAQDPEVGRVVRAVADQVAGSNMLILRQQTVRAGRERVAPLGAAAAERARQPRESPGTSMAFGWWSSGSAATLPVRLRRPASAGWSRTGQLQSRAGAGKEARTSPMAGSGSGRCARIW